MNRYILLSIITSFIISCTSNITNSESEPEEYYNLSTATDASISDIFSGVEAIPLLFEGDYYPESFYIMTSTDEHFIIQNNKGDIFVFDNVGHYVSSSKDVYGQGPGEYTIEMGTCWNPYNRQIAVITPKRLMRYDVEFNFIGESDIPTRYGDKDDTLLFSLIYPQSESKYLLGPTGFSIISGCFVDYDAAAGKLGEYLDFSNDMLANTNSQPSYFFRLKSGETLFAPPCMTNYVYSFNPDKLTIERKIKYDMGELSLTKADLDAHTNPENPLELGEYLLNTENPIPSRVLPTSDVIFFNVRRGRKVIDQETIAVNRKNGEIKRLPMFRNEKVLFPQLYDIDEDFVYAAVDKAQLQNSPELLLGKELTSVPNFDTLDDETYIVLKYRIK
ncbi:MAG: 6-bladed beta-propeller [Bacteroides sp.]|nr:6-bladed beta-propeller [Barnesiella sp.]MBD5324172.1 6-bladed beta-propeller [Bacteroides sp.]